MKVAIIGEFNNGFRPHIATNEAIEHSQKFLGLNFQSNWIPTTHVENNIQEVLRDYHGFWIAPGSPYQSMKGALELIKITRINSIPTFGTCGGFQHMVIEFARNVLHMLDAEHAEYDPYASRLIVNPLSCDLKGKALQIDLIDERSRVHALYESKTSTEKYYCNFGLNPTYQDQFDKNKFKIVGTDRHHEARILELRNHPFFIATLFVPQDNSSFEKPHRLVTGFIQAVLKYHSSVAERPFRRTMH